MVIMSVFLLRDRVLDHLWLDKLFFEGSLCSCILVLEKFRVLFL